MDNEIQNSYPEAISCGKSRLAVLLNTGNVWMFGYYKEETSSAFEYKGHLLQSTSGGVTGELKVKAMELANESYATLSTLKTLITTTTCSAVWPRTITATRHSTLPFLRPNSCNVPKVSPIQPSITITTPMRPTRKPNFTTPCKFIRRSVNLRTRDLNAKYEQSVDLGTIGRNQTCGALATTITVNST